MATLNEGATNEQIENFLLFHMDNADDRKAKINPSITKEEVWDIYMGAVMKGDITRVRSIIIDNITKEFGKYYKANVV